VKQRCLPTALNYPMLEEYGFRNDHVSTVLLSCTVCMYVSIYSYVCRYIYWFLWGTEPRLLLLYAGHDLDLLPPGCACIPCAVEPGSECRDETHRESLGRTKRRASARCLGTVRFRVGAFGPLFFGGRCLVTLTLDTHLTLSKMFGNGKVEGCGVGLSDSAEWMEAEASARYLGTGELSLSFLLGKCVLTLTLTVPRLQGRARSGIIVLPAGRASRWVGVSAAVRVGKSCLCLATNAVSVTQWRYQFLTWSTIREEQVGRLSL